MTTIAIEERQSQTPETPEPRPPSQAEEETQDGVNRLEMALTAICTVSLATAWLGGRAGLISGTPQLVLYIIAYISGGFFGTIEGLKALRHLELNVDFLMVLAALGAASIGKWAEGATLSAFPSTAWSSMGVQQSISRPSRVKAFPSPRK